MVVVGWEKRRFEYWGGGVVEKLFFCVRRERGLREKDWGGRGLRRREEKRREQTRRLRFPDKLSWVIFFRFYFRWVKHEIFHKGKNRHVNDVRHLGNQHLL